MSAGPTISPQKILAASQGDSASLLEVLNQICQVSVQQQTVTGTTATGTTAGQPNPSARRPAQATGTVSLLNGSYIVQLVNPGGKSALSNLQAAQAAKNATSATPLQPVTPIYHQIRVSTSRAFNVNSNTQTFGGDTGSTQIYWTLTGLGTGNWYFQFRSSYDGVNWNTWKNTNGGQGSSIEEVTVEDEGNTVWAVFSLPGKETMGVGEGYLSDQEAFGLPTGLYSSGMAAIAGPNGFAVEPGQINCINECDVQLQAPTTGTGATGTLDYPPYVVMKYGGRGDPPPRYSGIANVFAIAYDPTGENNTVYSSPLTSAGYPDVSNDYSSSAGTWAVFTLPGGSQFAVGSGCGYSGDTIFTPAECPWIKAANMLSICSIQNSDVGDNGAHGINQCCLTGLTLTATYADYGSADNVWTGGATWLAVAWSPGHTPVSVTGGEFLVINLSDGNKIAFGAGSLLNAGASFSLPPGFSESQLMTIGIPGSFSGSGDNVLHAVSQCDISGTTAQLTYVDGSGNSWSGAVNWFAFAWANASTVSSGTAGIVVTISPNQAVLYTNGTLTFTAYVSGTPTQTVTWSVDGVAGGNSTVSTITSGGVYTAPDTQGPHYITAASTVNSLIVGGASVTVN